MSTEPDSYPEEPVTPILGIPMENSGSSTGSRRIEFYLHLGRLLYESGATVQRISDSVQYCARSLGDKDVHVFVEYDAIEVSRRDGGSTQVSMQVFRRPMKANMAVLREISRMLAAATSRGCTVESMEKRLHDLENRPAVYPALLIILAVGMACAAFAYLNKADYACLWVVLIAGSAGMATRLYVTPKSPNLYLTVLLSALAASLVTLLLLPLSGTSTPAISVLSSVLFLVPLVFLINGGLDIIRDHNSCGIARITSFTMQMLVISAAILLPLSFIYQGIDTPGGGTYGLGEILLGILCAGVGSVGFAIMMNMPKIALAGSFLCGCTARGIREIAIIQGLDPLISIFCGMVAATLLAFLFADLTRVPEVMIAITAALPMSPGLSTIKGLDGLYYLAQPGLVVPSGLIDATVQNCVYAAGISLALIAGIILPLFLRMARPRI